MNDSKPREMAGLVGASAIMTGRISAVFCAGAALLSSIAAADVEIAVTNTPGYVQLDAKNAAQKLVAGTLHQTECPSDIDDLVFWFDCQQTNDWTFAGGEVAKIPSLVGERYLSTDTEGGLHKIAWTSKNPQFVESDPELGGPALDFGEKGSLRAMSFNPVGPEGTTTNMLDGIGAVFAVWYSAAGSGADGQGGYYGGALLGGGFGRDGINSNDKSQYVLYRTADNDRQSVAYDGDKGRYRWYDNPFVSSAHTHAAIQSGQLRQDGQAVYTKQVGFSAGWEVVSLTVGDHYGLFNATGLGMNDSRIYQVSGGFKVAEMLIFGRPLSGEETERVEAYLNSKWFARNARGWNGNAIVSRVRSFKNASGRPTATSLPVEVADGEKLTIGRLAGGRGIGAPSVVKTGSGALEIGDATAYGGSVTLAEGSLEFTRREIPTALPHDAYLHFDPSNPDSLVTDGEGEFLLLRNLAAKSTWRAEAICARPAGVTPTLLANELGPGLHALDLGDYVQNDFTRRLRLATNETEEVESVRATPARITTIIAVVGAQRGGGGLLGQEGNQGYFARASSAPCRFDVAFFTSYAANHDGTTVAPYSVPLTGTSYAKAWIDSLPADGASAGYVTPAWQVVAVQTPGNNSSGSIGSTPWGSGGIRLGEFVAYRRILSEEELRDASAYLMRKWLNKEAPGYARFRERKSPDIVKVVATGDAVVDVKSGEATVGALSVDGGTITKSGSGKLNFYDIDASEVCIDGGTLSKKSAPDVSSASELAAEPALHLDVTDASSMKVVAVDGERRVLEWYSQGDRTVMAMSPYKQSDSSTKYDADNYVPYLSSEAQLNGHDTLDFGPYTRAAGGRALSLSRSFDCVRSAYIVWTPRDDTRGTYFGNSRANGDTNGELYDFLRKESATNSAALVDTNDTADHVREGKIYTNGVQTAASAVMQPGVFTLTEFHPSGGAHISALGTDRDVARFTGGIRVAEVVLYERALSEREKVATRNYLMAKWFNAEPQALPEKPDDGLALKRIVVSGSASADLGDAAVELAGNGMFVKDGGGELSVQNLCSYSGVVTVASGTFKMNGRRPSPTAELAAPEALIYHADATWGVTAVTNDGVVQVTEWKSKLDDGWTVRPVYDDYKPTIMAADDLNGGLVVDMGKSGDRQALRFYKNGETNMLDGIVSVVWLVGSHNGGGYLLGGGHNYNNWNGGRFNFMRGSPGGIGNKAEYPLLNSAWVCPYNLQSADWRMDGGTVKPLETGLSGGWDLVAMRIVNTSYPTSNADGFAFDGRTLDDNSLQTYMGCQRLAEVLIYNRKLTDEEFAATEEYLRMKWGLAGTYPALTNAAEIDLAAGAVLDCGGTNQYVAALSGAGVVSNGVLAVGTLAADPTAETPAFDSSASLAIEPGQRIVVSNASMEPGATVVVFEGDVVGAENLPDAVLEFAGAPCPGYVRPRLRYENGVLFVKFLPRGLAITIR